MKKENLVWSKKAISNKGFQENIKHMEAEGYSKKRAVGTAYGEADKAYDKMNRNNGLCKGRLSGAMGK